MVRIWLAYTATSIWKDMLGRSAALSPYHSIPSLDVPGGDDSWTWDITIDATDSGVTVTHHNTGPAVRRYVGVLMKLEERSS